MRVLKGFGIKHFRHILFICALWALAFAWFIVCIGLSSQTGKETGELSKSIASFIAETIHLPGTSVPGINKGLRLAAHFFCFFVLSILTGGACAATFRSAASAFSWPFLPCVVFAFADEMRKANIPGRHCSFPEAWLNVAGCAMGVIILGIILWLFRWRK